MPLRLEDLSPDPAHLTGMLLASEAGNARLRAAIIQLKSMIFGSRPEKRVTIIGEQLPLDLDAQAVTSELAIPANDDQASSPPETTKKRKRNIGAFRRLRRPGYRQNICRVPIC